MHNKVIFAAIFAFTASQMVAETSAVSALSPEEQIHHRLRWCERANLEFSLARGTADVPTYNKAVDTKNGIRTAAEFIAPYV